MKVALLPGVGAGIGLGHFQRCVTLARALVAAGHRCAIIIDASSEGATGTIRALAPDGIAVASTIDEAFECAGCAPHRACSAVERIDWAVIDDYAADVASDRALRRSADRVLVLDDHGMRARDADVLLSQALTMTEHDYAGLVPEACQVLAGPRFVLIRPEFGTSAHLLPDAPQCGVLSIFVSMGGTDAGRTLERVLVALAGLADEREISVHVMISTLSRTVNRLDALVDELPYECVVHRDLRDPVELMSGCDAAVTSGGMTSFELATLRVPVVIIPSTPLEARVAEALCEHAEAHVIDADVQGWESELRRTLVAFGPRDRSAARPSVFDAGGAERVVRVMESLAEGSDRG